MKKRHIIGAILLSLIVSLAVGCNKKEVSKEEIKPLKVGLMPAVDAAPMLLAEKQGYFDEVGLEVEFEIFNNAQNRQSALQSNAIDGTITDLISVATNVDGGFDIKATMMTEGAFPVLMKKGSEDKQTIKVGMMEVSVTNFLIEQWLGEKYDIEKVFINDIPTRLAAIVSGELDMGVFPEPMASMGALQGLEKKVYGLEDEYCPDVLVFTGKALAEKEKAIQLFHEAYNKAVEDIQKNDQEARDILIEKLENLNPDIKKDMVLPKFKKATLQDKEYIEKIIRWTANTIKKDLKVSADDLVERKFVK